MIEAAPVLPVVDCPIEQIVALYTTGQKIGSCAQKIGFTSPLQKIKKHERTNLHESQPKFLSLIRTQDHLLRCRF